MTNHNNTLELEIPTRVVLCAPRLNDDSVGIIGMHTLDSFCAPTPIRPCWHLPLHLPWHCCRRPPPPFADVIRANVITTTRELIYELPLLLIAELVRR